MTPPRLTVIILSYNTRDLLARCLECLMPQVVQVSAAVVVVDNASTDDSVEMVRSRFPSVQLITSHVNLGFAAGNNLALRTLTTPYVLLLNSDTEVGAGTLPALLECMHRYPRVGAVGCRLLNPDGSLQRSCWRFPGPTRTLGEAVGLTRMLSRHSNYEEWDYSSERRVDFVIGACLLLRKAALDQVGLFDERFFMYSEETDLCLRLARAGWETWYTPMCSVVHHGGASGSGATSSGFLTSRDLYLWKWYGWPGLVLTRTSQMLGALLRIVAFSAALLLRPSLLLRHQIHRQRTVLLWTLRAFFSAPGSGVRPSRPPAASGRTSA